MKRVLIILCCICLIICLAAPALAATYFWQDYVVSTEPGFDYDTYDVFIPSSAISCGWSGTGNFDDSASPHVFYTVPDDKLYVNLTLDVCTRKDYLSLDGIDLQSTLNLYVDANKLNASKGYYYCRYECVDSDGNTITTIQDNSANFDSSFGEIKIDLTSLPEGTVGIRPRLLVQYLNLVAGETYELNFIGLSFDVLQPPSMTGSYEFMQLQNYIVNESSDGDTSKLYCSIPFSDFNTVTWYKLQGEDQQRVQSGMGQSFTTVLEEDPYGWWIDCSPFSGRQYIDITDVVNGSTFSVSFDITYAEEYPQQLPGMSGRYQVRYYDKDFNLIGDVQFMDMEEVYWDMNELSFTIDKPENAVGMSFILQFTNVNSLSYPNAITLDFHSVDLVCDIPTMVRVQQETGRTNQLLDELINGDHGFDSSGSNFGSEADQLAGAGDQMNDAMGSGMNSLGSMTNSVAFTGTLTTLAGVMDAVFVGHEITICGVTANPFTLLVSIFAIAILLPLALKFVFRKWGSGGG